MLVDEFNLAFKHHYSHPNIYRSTSLHQTLQDFFCHIS